MRNAHKKKPTSSDIVIDVIARLMTNIDAVITPDEYAYVVPSVLYGARKKKHPLFDEWVRRCGSDDFETIALKLHKEVRGHTRWLEYCKKDDFDVIDPDVDVHNYNAFSYELFYKMFVDLFIMPASLEALKEFNLD
jgi:hypothetical protein